MCYAEEINYRCGHRSAAVVRPCPLTTSGHNNPVCQIQFTYEYSPETMCVACERILHSRWTLLQEFEHRWYHERGVCGCDVKFPALDIRPRVIGTGADDGCPSDDEITFGSSPTVVASTPEEAQVQKSRTKGQSKTSHNKHPVEGPVDKGKRVVVVGGKPGHGPEDHIPARYQETTEGDKTHVAVRQASQYAAEWLEDHREVHAQGGCHCRVDMKPFTPADSDGPLNADGEKVLALHHQITGDGVSKKEWAPPSKEDIERWRAETDVPELGTQARWTINRRQAPDATKYPVPLGNNMFLTEHFVVWDAKLLASRVESMQISSPTHGHGGNANVKVSNGKAPAAQEAVYVYQPHGNGHHKGMQKKGGRRFAGRHRRDTVNNRQHADAFGAGMPVDPFCG